MKCKNIAFPVVRGLQAGHEYWGGMVRIADAVRLFQPSNPLLPVCERSNRAVDARRVPAIAEYIKENLGSYIFSSVVVAIDGDVKFHGEKGTPWGTLTVGSGASFFTFDGQHRLAGLGAALNSKTHIGHEHLLVMFVMYLGVESAQQRFSDLNNNARKPSPSLSLYYDGRNRWAEIARAVLRELPALSRLVDFEKASPGAKSGALFGFKAFSDATRILLSSAPEDQSVKLGVAFWNHVFAELSPWSDVSRRALPVRDAKERFIVTHAVILHALARVGAALLQTKGWAPRLSALSGIDWTRGAGAWDGRCVLGGRVRMDRRAVVATGRVIKEALGMPLTADDSVGT